MMPAKRDTALLCGEAHGFSTSSGGQSSARPSHSYVAAWSLIPGNAGARSVSIIHITNAGSSK